MRKNGFTLIEVMVVMAIISILAGMITPVVWKFQENEEIATTKQRLQDLKFAMVGDRSLVQDGIRRSYGFVGDNGELPFGNATAAGGLKYLANRPAFGYPKWAGSYMKGGFDPATYIVDAWGRVFAYTPGHVPDDEPYRYVYAEIRSYGPNGIPNDDDDIFINIEEKEVTPSSKIIGKIFANITSTAKLKARVTVTYRDPNSSSGIKEEKLACMLIKDSYVFHSYSATHTQKFPIGTISYSSSIHSGSDTDCSGTALRKLESYYFIQDDVKEMLVNFPPYNNP